MLKLLLLLALGGLMRAATSFSPEAGSGHAPAGTALASGYLLLTAFLAGSVFKKVGLPRLTGYLASGIVVGPHLCGLVSEAMLADLTIVNGIAVALIAMAAGVEMDLRSMRPLLRAIGAIASLSTLLAILLLTAGVFLLAPHLGFMQGLGTREALALALVLGVTMSAHSPAVVVALREETEADGPLSQTVLGAVVVGDLLVIVLFAAASTLAKSLLGAGADLGATVRLLGWEILGSVVVGLGIGALLAVYLRRVKAGGSLFTVAVCFVIAEVGRRVHLDPLLLALAAGMLVRNATAAGPRLQAELDAGALPVSITFFAVAGASIHLDALGTVGVPAAALVALRALGLLGGTRLGARLAEAPAVVRRYAGVGLLPQAGLALALGLLLARTFPALGSSLTALVFSVVALNELVAPVLLRAVLVRSGEAGRRARRPTPAEIMLAPK